MDEFKCQKCNYTFYDIEIDECPYCGFPIQLFIDREMILDVQGTLVGVRVGGVITGVILIRIIEKTLNFLERIMFKGSYLEKKKQLELSCPPIVNEYQNCCKELENIQNILVKLRKKHRGYSIQINGITSKVKKLKTKQDSLKLEIAELEYC